MSPLLNLLYHFLRITKNAALLLSWVLIYSASAASTTLSEVFIESKGQVKDENGNPVDNVLFYSQGRDMQLFITTTGYSIVTTGPAGGKTVYHKIDFALQNASLNRSQVIFTEGSFPALHFYHAGNVLEDVRSSGTVIIKDVYPGIDWVWGFDKNKNPKHEFMVNIGADASVIQYVVSGAEAKLGRDNSIIYSNDNVSIKEGPVLLQHNDKEFPGNIVIENNRVGFQIPQQLKNGGFTIDPPLQLLWAAVLDSTLRTAFKYIVKDDADNSITVGYSSDFAVPTFPQVNGSYEAFPPRANDVVIMKADYRQDLMWATFFGGSNNDEANAVAASPTSIFITGFSESWDFPRAVHGTYNEPVQFEGRDAFLLKFNDDGKWIWSTGYGGENADEGMDIQYYNGRIYVAGYTESDTFPTLPKPGAYYQGSREAQHDAFLLEFDTLGNPYWATYFGGSGDDYFTSLSVRNTGIYLTGYSDSITGSSIPLLSNGGSYFQDTFQKAESFITRFSTAGALEWSTYFGGTANDHATCIVENNCAIFICGSTDGAGLPVLSQLNGNYFQPNYAGGPRDGFIAKFDPVSLQQLYCTYYGTAGDDVLTKIASDTLCSTVATGFTNDSITRVGSPSDYYIQDTTITPRDTLRLTTYDGIMIGLDENQAPFWSTHFGSDEDDFGYGVLLNCRSVVEMVGAGYYNYGKGRIGGTYVHDMCNTHVAYCPNVTSNGVSNRFFMFDSLAVDGPCGEDNPPPGPCQLILQFHALIPLQNTCPRQCNGIAMMDTANIGGCPPYLFLWETGHIGLMDSNLCESYWSRVYDAAGRIRTVYGRFNVLKVTGSEPAVTYCDSVTPDWYELIEIEGGTPPYIITVRGIMPGCPSNVFFDISDSVGCIITHSQLWYRFNAGLEINFEVTDECFLLAEPVLPADACEEIPDTTNIVIYAGVDTFIIPYSEVRGIAPLTFPVTPGTRYSGFLDLPDCPIPIDAMYSLDTIRSTITKTLACTDTSGRIDITVYGDSGAIAINNSYSVSIFVSGNSTTYDTVLSFTDTAAQTYSLTNLPGGSYFINIFTDNCDTLPSTVVDLRTFDFQFNAPSVFCGVEDTLTAIIEGGYPPYSFQWSPAGDDTASIYISTPGIYALTITDSAGCVVSHSKIIPGSAPLQIDSIAENTAPCAPGLFSTATVFTSGGTPPLFYVWSSGETSATANFLTQGTNWVRVFDVPGCADIDSFQHTKQLPMLVSDSLVDASCYSYSDGAVGLSVTFGYPNFSVDWSGGGSGLSLQNLAAGDYAYTITDARGCVDSNSVTIGEPDSIEYFPFTFPATCNTNDGFANVNITGGAGGYSILWQDSDTNFVRSDLNPGTHPFTVTDTNGCNQSGAVTVAQYNPPFDGSIAESATKCFGTADGIAVVTVNNPNNPITYTWDNGETGAIADSLTAGFHSVEIIDSLGCVYYDSAFIDQPAVLSIDVIQTGPAACADTNGFVFLGVIGGTQPYQATWDDGGTGISRNNISSGPHAFTVTDANNCQTVGNAIIPQNNPIIVDITVNNPECTNVLHVGAYATVTNALSPFTYLWSDGSTQPATSAFTSLSLGEHYLTVTDSRNCVSIDTFEVVDDFILTAHVDTGAGIRCHGELATVFVYGTGGNTPFGHSLSLGPGTYTDSVIDLSGCKAYVTFTLSEPDSFGADISVTQPTCLAGASATITASGGVRPYRAWSGSVFLDTFSSSLTFTQLSPQHNNIRVQDANLCEINLGAYMNPPGKLADYIGTNPVCAGDSNGEIWLYMSSYSGITPFTIHVNSMIIDSVGYSISFPDLPAGAYHFLIEDFMGCRDSFDIQLVDPAPLTAHYAVLQDFKCHGDSALISISGSGGVPPYSGAVDYHFPAGSFTQIITDSYGCSASVPFSLTQPDSFIANIAVVQPGCDTSGAVNISASGGTTPYHAWYASNDLGLFDPNLTATPISGSNTILISDSAGCEVQFTATVNDLVPLNGVAFATDLTCHGDSTSAQIIMTSGTGPFSILGTSFTGTFVLNDLTSGNYAYVVTDAANCADTVSFSISEPAQVVAHYNILQDFICHDDSVLVVFYGTGGTPPYTGAGTTWYHSGTFVHTITDANGCAADTSLSLAAPAPFTVDTFLTLPDCNNTSGSVILNASGGAGPYTTQVGNNSIAFNDTVTLPLFSGNYIYAVSDTLGCTRNISFSIAPVNVVGGNIRALPPGCDDDSSGILTIVMEQGAPPYLVNGISFSDSITFTGLPAGNYQYTVADANNCIVQLSGVITQSEQIVIDSFNLLIPITCHSREDAALEVIASGGSPAYTYALISPLPDTLLQNAHIFTELSSGTYTVIVTDESGCFAVDTVSIDAYVPSVHLIELDSIRCYGDSTGAIKIYSEPAGRGPFNYSLNGGTPQPYDVFYDLAAGNYQVVVTDKYNCYDTLYASLSQPDSIDTRVWLNGELLPLDSVNVDENDLADFTKLNLHPWEVSASPATAPLIHSDSLIRIQAQDNFTYTVTVYLDSLHLDCFVEYKGLVIVRDVPDLPNIITPNGDGLNDTWEVDLNEYPSPEIIIFDRWGEIIFQSEDYSNNWDGTNDSERIADGTYFYLMTVAAHGNKVYKGNINVLNSSK